MKSHCKFYGDISITKGPSIEAMFRFCDINVIIQGENETNVIDGEEVNDIENRICFIQRSTQHA